jgi:hypothetical protein
VTVAAAGLLALLPVTVGGQVSGEPADLDARDGGVPHFAGHWSFRSSEIYEDRALLGEAGFGVLVGGRDQVGLAGVGTIRPSSYGTLEFSLAYGGLRLEHEVRRRGRLATRVSLLVGGGRFTVTDTASDTEQSTGVGVVEPEARSGFRLAGPMWISVGAGYRWVAGIEGDIPNRSDGDARGAALIFMIGGR